MTSPEPTPPEAPLPARIVTTDGSFSSATAGTSHDPPVPEMAVGVALEVPLIALAINGTDHASRQQGYDGERPSHCTASAGLSA